MALEEIARFKAKLKSGDGTIGLNSDGSASIKLEVPSTDIAEAVKLLAQQGRAWEVIILAPVVAQQQLDIEEAATGTAYSEGWTSEDRATLDGWVNQAESEEGGTDEQAGDEEERPEGD